MNPLMRIWIRVSLTASTNLALIGLVLTGLHYQSYQSCILQSHYVITHIWRRRHIASAGKHCSVMEKFSQSVDDTLRKWILKSLFVKGPVYTALIQNLYKNVV